LAFRREDAGDADQVVAGDPGVAQGQLEAGQFLAMGAHPFSEEELFGYVHRRPWRLSPTHRRTPTSRPRVGNGSNEQGKKFTANHQGKDRGRARAPTIEK